MKIYINSIILFKGQYGINDVYLSVPTIVNRNGASKVLEVELFENEKINLLNQVIL